MPGDFVINKISDTSFDLVHKDGKESYLINLVNKDGHLDFDGMP